LSAKALSVKEDPLNQKLPGNFGLSLVGRLTKSGSNPISRRKTC
jgi:hypothetical protein